MLDKPPRSFLNRGYEATSLQGLVDRARTGHCNIDGGQETSGRYESSTPAGPKTPSGPWVFIARGYSLTEIVIHSRDYCGSCARAKPLPKAKGAAYRDIEQHPRLVILGSRPAGETNARADAAPIHAAG